MRGRVALMWLAVAGAGFPAAAQQHRAPAKKHFTYVIVHGAWGGGWDWRAVDSLLTRDGHKVQRVTLTGLGERHHLVSPDIGLDTHIEDVVNTILWENLHDVVQVLPQDRVDDVFDVRVEPDVRRDEVMALAEAGERDALDLVAVAREQRVDGAPIPAAAPRAVHDDIGEMLFGWSAVLLRP